MCEVHHTVEIVDHAAMLADLPDAVARENHKHGTSVTVEEARENLLDWCPPEHFTTDRRFPTRPMAMGWAKKNAHRDCFGQAIVRTSEIDCEGDERTLFKAEVDPDGGVHVSEGEA